MHENLRYAVKTGDQSLIVNYIAERQTPFNPDATRILSERSFLSLSEAGQGNCTRYNMKLQVANLVVFYTPLHDHAGYTKGISYRSASLLHKETKEKKTKQLTKMIFFLNIQQWSMK